jgi:hypothetical protein
VRNGWPGIIRTTIIDELLAASLAEGCDPMLNLAGGFDTRPHRMRLPATFAASRQTGPRWSTRRSECSTENPIVFALP